MVYTKKGMLWLDKNHVKANERAGMKNAPYIYLAIFDYADDGIMVIFPAC